jgi:hypothetical protein
MLSVYPPLINYFIKITPTSPCVCMFIPPVLTRQRLGEVEVEVTLQLTVGRSVSLSWYRAPLWGPWADLLFFFFCLKIALIFVLKRPLWREDGFVICSAICQWSESRRTHNHTLLSLLGSLSVASYDSQELRWKHSYPPPHGEYPFFHW